MWFAVAMAHDGIELDSVPLRLNKVLFCVLKYEKHVVNLWKLTRSIFNHGTKNKRMESLVNSFIC